MNFVIDVSELAGLAKDLAREVAVSTGKAEEAVGRSTARLHSRAKGSAPVETGELRESITADASGLARRVYATARAGFFQEYGTSVMPPHPFLMIHADWAHADLAAELLDVDWLW